MLNALMRFFAYLACRRPWWVLGGSVILAAICVVITTTSLELNADLDDLIAPDRPFMDVYRRFQREFGDLEFIFVVLAAADTQQRHEAAHYIAQRLESLQGVHEGVYYVIKPQEQLRISTRAMDDDELAELAMASQAFSALHLSPAGATSFALDQLGALFQSSDENQQQRMAASAFMVIEAMTQDQLIPLPEPEYLVSQSGALQFIQIRPVRDFSTLAVIQQPLEEIRAVLDEARERFPDVELGLTGKPVLQADEMATSDRDMTRAFILSIILVAILFMIVLGSIWHPALAVVALLFGIAWIFGFTTVVVGQLTLLSIVFTIVLVGVGIDFGVHIVSRYKEQRERDTKASIESAMHATLMTAGHGNSTGAITSCAALYMTLFTDFQGLRELGFIAGSGLLLCLLAMLLVLPALIVVFDRWREKRGSSPTFLPKPSAAQRSAWNALMARPGTWLLIALGITFVLAPTLRRLDFEKNLLELQAQNLESVQWEHRILDDSAESFFGAVIVDTPEQALEVIQRAEQEEAVARAGSIFDIIKPPSETREALRQQLHQYMSVKHEDSNEPLTADQITPLVQHLTLILRGAQLQQLQEVEYLAGLLERVQTLRGALADPDAAAGVRARITERLATAAERVDLMLEGDQLPLYEALPEAIRGQFVSADGQLLLVTLHPVENVWEFEPMERFVAAMRRIHPDATGVPITQYESLIEMLRAFITTAILAFIVVFLLMWLDLGKFVDAALAMSPLLVGLLWLLIWMGIFDIRFNHANFFAVPVLIGIGVDSGIHLVRRYREVHPRHGEGKQRNVQFRDIFGSTPRAVFMTSMTTLIGFGCLVIAHHRGLQSLGIVMAIGAATTLIASLVILPAILACMQRWREGQ